MPLRSRLRWLNGVGFALTFFFAFWLLAFLLALLEARFADVVLPMPTAFAVVGAISLLAMIVLLGIVLLGFIARGADMNDWKPRLLLFAWTCAGGLFFLSQALVLLRCGSDAFPHAPSWLSGVYWYFVVVGSGTFPLLLWANAETPETDPG